MKKKTCRTCERSLPLDQFNDGCYSSGDGKIAYCYDCLRIWTAQKNYDNKIKGRSKYCPYCKKDLPLERFATLDTWYRFKVNKICLSCESLRVMEVERELKARLNTPMSLLLKNYYVSAAKKCTISKQEFKDLVGDNLKVCWICGEQETSRDNRGFVKRLSVDHCHKTNKIRGLLCTRCNMAIGLMRDNIDIIASAISYLQQP